MLIIAAASVLEELSQGLFPARTFDFGDMAANLAGIALFGALAAGLVSARRRSSASSTPAAPGFTSGGATWLHAMTPAPSTTNSARALVPASSR